MQARRLALLAVVVGAGVLGGCSSYAYYTRTTLEDLNLSPEAVKRVQFYVDVPFTLVLDRTTAASRVRRYEVDTTRERYVKHIEVVEKAGAEVLDVGEDWIKVEVAYDMRLEFRADPKNPEKMFFLRAINDQPADDGGTIHYRDNYYKVLFGTVNRKDVVEARGRPRLLYELSSARRLRRDREEIGGVWLEDRDRARRAAERYQRGSGDD
ncbi:MAG: hypothetical protein JXQ29_01345 [Planctomycetes bacterium]|nr:hypothetical protein [Planctomycetota bacterium]